MSALHPGAAIGTLPTVLVVDDEPCVRGLLTRILANQFHIVEAGDGLTAFHTAQEILEAIVLVITDIDMPAADGLTFATMFRGLAPSVPIVFITGLHLPAAATASISAEVLAKPFTLEEVLDVVARVMAGSNSASGDDAAEM